MKESGGKLSLLITYERPDRVATVDPAKDLTVRFNGQMCLQGQGPHETQEVDLDHAIGYLDRHEARRRALEVRRAACGNPRAPWGHKKGWRRDQDVISRLTEQRTLAVKDINHAWSRRIRDRALSWRCGTVVVEPLPMHLGMHTWPWSQFVQCVRYKVEELGCKLIVRTAIGKYIRLMEQWATVEAPRSPLAQACLDCLAALPGIRTLATEDTVETPPPGELEALKRALKQAKGWRGREAGLAKRAIRTFLEKHR